MATLFAQHTNPANLRQKGSKHITDHWNARCLDALPTYIDLDLNLKYKKEPSLEKYRKIVVLVNQLREFCGKDGKEPGTDAGDMPMDGQAGPELAA